MKSPVFITLDMRAPRFCTSKKPKRRSTYGTLINSALFSSSLLSHSLDFAQCRLLRYQAIARPCRASRQCVRLSLACAVSKKCLGQVPFVGSSISKLLSNVTKFLFPSYTRLPHGLIGYTYMANFDTPRVRQASSAFLNHVVDPSTSYICHSPRFVVRLAFNFDSIIPLLPIVRTT